MPSTIPGTIWVKISTPGRCPCPGARGGPSGRRRGPDDQRQGGRAERHHQADEDGALPAWIGEQGPRSGPSPASTGARAGSSDRALRLDAGDQDPERREHGPDDRAGPPRWRTAPGAPWAATGRRATARAGSLVLVAHERHVRDGGRATVAPGCRAGTDPTHRVARLVRFLGRRAPSGAARAAANDERAEDHDDRQQQERERRRVPQAQLVDRRLEDVVGHRRRLEARAALGQLEDHVEDLERDDDGQDGRDQQQWPDRGQRDVAERLPRSRTVHAGRTVVRFAGSS